MKHSRLVSTILLAAVGVGLATLGLLWLLARQETAGANRIALTEQTQLVAPRGYELEDDDHYVSDNGAYREVAVYPVDNANRVVEVQYFKHEKDLRTMSEALIAGEALERSFSADIDTLFGPDWEWYEAPASSPSRLRAIAIGLEDLMLVEVYSDDRSTPASKILLRYVDRSPGDS